MTSRRRRLAIGAIIIGGAFLLLCALFMVPGRFGITLPDISVSYPVD